MRMLDSDREQRVRVLQLYMTAREAEELCKGLSKLLENPERNDHFHVFAKNMSSEISVSIVTKSKLNSGGYTAIESRIFSED